MTGPGRDGLFAGLFDRGAAGTDDEAWLQAMLDAEAALARALERAGLAAEGSGAAVTSVASVSFFRDKSLSGPAATAGNPVPALVKTLTGLIPAVLARGDTASPRDTPDPDGPEPPEMAARAADAVHRGATSQDIIDTAAMLISSRVIDAALADLAVASGHAADLARSHAGTVMAGRTLLQHAVPVTFGLVAAGWLTSIDEARDGLRAIRSRRLAVQFGGAAGTLAALGEAGPTVTALLADELGLAVPVLPWHTDRLRIIELAAALAGTCAVLGKIARDVTLLAQTEVAEVSEDLAGGERGGSSAMPHKQNPIASVVILGCAKRAPGLLATLAAAAEQEHQRAAGAWHAEWETLSDLLRLTGSAAAWAADLLCGLQIHPAAMRANLDATGGLPMAEHLATLLTPALGRLPAHDLIAQASLKAIADDTNLADALLTNPETAAKLADAKISRAQIEAALNPETYLGATAEFIHRALTAHAEQNSS